MSDKVRLAVVGTSGRGTGHVNTLAGMPDVELAAVCDIYEDRVQNAKKSAEKIGNNNVSAYTDYKAMIAAGGIDGIVIASSWDSHGYVAAAALSAGIYTAVECGGACSIDECWQIVRAYEKTGAHCMYLENCCYGREEMTLLRMIKENMFGEIIHAQGGYEHDLRDEVAYGHEHRHYRYDNYRHRNAELYPAHALGPMQKYVNINRGNRMLTLVSMASKARGLHEYIVKSKGPESEYASHDINQGDVVNTLIKCAHGETLMLTHDTTLPRPYSRGGRVQGTRGLWMEDKASVYLEGKSPDHTWEDFSKYMDDPAYEHPLWTEFRTKGVEGGHGGMDYLVLRAFVESVRKQTEPPLDAYDTATLMAVTVLSEQSIMLGSAPVAIPDFTDGKWIKRGAAPRSKYALDAVCHDLFE